MTTDLALVRAVLDGDDWLADHLLSLRIAGFAPGVVRRGPYKITPEFLSSIAVELGARSKADLAQSLGVSERTIVRWRASARRQGLVR